MKENIIKKKNKKQIVHMLRVICIIVLKYL